MSKNVQKLVCREILDGKDVIKDQVKSTIIAQLRQSAESGSNINMRDVTETSRQVEAIVEAQVSALLDRVIKVLSAK